MHYYTILNPPPYCANVVLFNLEPTGLLRKCCIIQSWTRRLIAQMLYYTIFNPPPYCANVVLYNLEQNAKIIYKLHHCCWNEKKKKKKKRLVSIICFTILCTQWYILSNIDRYHINYTSFLKVGKVLEKVYVSTNLQE